MQDILDKGNNALGDMYDGDSPLSLSGSASVTAKLVDKHDDGSQYGNFVSADGSVSFTAGSASVSSPDIPTSIPGVTWSIQVSTTGLTITFTCSGRYDESKATPGSFNATLSGGTVFAVQGATKALGIVTLSVTGSVSISASGSVSLNTNDEIVGSGSVEVSNPTLNVSVEVNYGIGKYVDDIGTYTAPLNATQKFGPTTLHTF